MAAGSSNSFDASTRIRDREFLYASNVNVSNFVSVKLSGKRNYHFWKTQMLCLLESHRMGGIVDDLFASPRASSTPQTWEEYRSQYESLVKGWIFGSVSEDVLGNIVNLDSAKDVWNKLNSIYDPAAMICQEEPNIKKDVVSGEKDTHGEETATEEVTPEEKKKIKLFKAILKGDWVKAKSILEKEKQLVEEVIRNHDRSTVLHIAVGTGHSYQLKMLLSTFIRDKKSLEVTRSDGCTALHIAAIVGNKHAANLLVKKNKDLLQMEDDKGEKPLDKAYENMHLDTITYLYKEESCANPDSEKGSDSEQGAYSEKMVKVLVTAISANQYKIALGLVKTIPEAVWKNEDVLEKVLLAIAQNFPNGLNDLEKLMYPSLGYTMVLIKFATQALFVVLFSAPEYILRLFCNRWSSYTTNISKLLWYVFLTALGINFWTIILTILVILVVWFLLLVLYWLLWKGARILIAPIKHIDNKKKEMDYAKAVLKSVWKKIDMLKFDDRHYKGPLLAASRQNAYKVVKMILFRSPGTIYTKDDSGYDVIQLAIINRSEKIYNLIYDLGEQKNFYRRVTDSSNNNILHLAGRLAPPHELNKRRGAALQLQRELQWFEEIKKLVFPTYITEANSFGETPHMVFTREHENLVKEGEKWMKTTAKSWSIAAALITTIGFAAAITVPGGSDEKSGIPLFIEHDAFIVFALSDAISLVASITALLVFLSILTARFSQDDFLVSLPRRLLIGLISILVSTIAIMVAFSATLFLVFCEEKQWLLAPVCVLAFIPIVFFVTFQLPLIGDLFLSTYFPNIGERKIFLRRSNPDDIRSVLFK